MSFGKAIGLSNDILEERFELVDCDNAFWK